MRATQSGAIKVKHVEHMLTLALLEQAKRKQPKVVIARHSKTKARTAKLRFACRQDELTILWMVY